MGMDINTLTEKIRRDLNAREEELTDEQVRQYIEDCVFDNDDGMRSLSGITRMIDAVFFSLSSDLSILQPYI